MSGARRAGADQGVPGEDLRGPENPEGGSAVGGDAGDAVARVHPVKRVLLGTAGGLLLAVGVALLVLPGPGMLLVLAGLVLLSRAVPAVARFEEPVRVRAMDAVEASVAGPWRIAGSVLAGLGLVAAGVVWGTGAIPRLPFAGWSTGSSLILSGFILLGLLVWSYRRVHSRTAAADGSGRADVDGRAEGDELRRDCARGADDVRRDA